MNISHMMRGLIGEAATNDTRAMELNVGQIVRGVIMQMLDNNEAVVNINGVPVRATLESPMQLGQAAMLQVQPQSGSALIVLKHVDAAASGVLLEETFKEWAKALSLPEQKWAADIIKDLRREGISLTRELGQAFQGAAAAKPANVTSEQWMQAASAVVKRGLPVTAATVGALHQVMHGTTANQLLDQLQQQLTAAVREGAAATGGDAKGLPPAAARVLALLTEGAPLLRAAAGGESQLTSSASSVGSARGELAAAPLTAAQTQSQASKQGSGSAQQAVQHSNTAAMALGSASASGSSNWLGQMMKWLGVDYEQQLGKSILSDSTGTRAQSHGTGTQQAISGGDMNQAANAAAARTAAQPQAEQQTAAMNQSLGRLAAEADGDMAVMRGDTRAMAGNERAALPLHTNFQAAAAGGAAADTPPSAQESLKGALLALAASDDVAPAVRETVQQLVQHITGQQLLLAPERSSSLFTHVTMFVPLNGEDGGQTASVHIQTRRGRKGELDAANCRLLFNLSMATLGDTLVDVNVVDKIVSLNIWNDHPAAAALIDSSRQEVAESMSNAGYQLLSLRATPLVPKEQQLGEEKAASAAAPPDLSQFSVNRYKGVDMRV